ncbi:MAG TPA: hypothetical protein VE549_04585, partial [Myxococcaceae bacterium]|nr:hypothetical protein [Myxococcaceae bacterium]
PLGDAGSVDVNASQNCCDGKKAVCKLDRAGIPRCFGGCPNNNCGQCPTGYTGQAPCCIAIGQECQFADQCCSGAPCVPGQDGRLRCTLSACIPLGSACSPGGGADGGNPCCTGQCITSEFGAFCQILTVVDAGTPDAGEPPPPPPPPCVPNGQPCSSTNTCCSLLNCSNGVCPTPGACVPTGAVCTADSDCCTGLSCVGSGSGEAGSCEVVSQCANAGQSCSAANPCCDNLYCTCDGPQCSCQVIIN